jgi:heat shock protein HslJ
MESKATSITINDKGEKMKRGLFSGITVTLLAFAGCSAPQPPNPVAPKAVKTPPLTGTTWQLMSFGDHKTPVPEQAWVMFEADGRLQGEAGCSGLSGRYTLNGSDITISLDPHIMRACRDIREDTRMRQRLQGRSHIERADGMLLFYRSGKRVLMFLPRKGKIEKSVSGSF